MMKFNILRKFVLGYKATSESYIKYLRKHGALIGDDVTLFRPNQSNIGGATEAFLLQIGNHVNMTGPITILTHDYSWSVLKRRYGEILGNQKRVVIGNNIFIGWGATILCGTTVEDNTIIGANSVVSGHLEGNSVYAGNPAKKLMSLDEYYKKRKDKQFKEAVNFALQYKNRFGEMPPKEKMYEFFPLFETGYNNMPEKYLFQLRLMGNYEESVEKLHIGSARQFEGYDEFIRYCLEQSD